MLYLETVKGKVWSDHSLQNKRLVRQWYKPGKCQIIGKEDYVKNICDKICHHQEKAYISRYESLQLYCCDSFKLHKKKISKCLCKTVSELVANLKTKDVLKVQLKTF